MFYVIFGFKLDNNIDNIKEISKLSIINYDSTRYYGIILNTQKVTKINPYDIEFIRQDLYHTMSLYNIKIPYSYKPQIYIISDKNLQ